jgi:hypothetical protein
MLWRDATQTIRELRDQEVLPAPAGDADGGDEGGRGIGERLGRYILLHRLGSGGMGVVFSAYDPELDRKVALKLVRPETDSPAARDALRREAQAMARLSHPNIVAVHDVGSDDHEVFLAMDLIEGTTLSEWLQLGERSWRDILRVFLQAGRGLAAAHAAGVVHRDFSPRNVLVTQAQEARITDFGLARAQDQTLETSEEAVRGTPAYLAPERLLGVAVDPRSDQFSFCAALYKALCGTLPYPADNPVLYLERVNRKDFAPPQGRRRVPRRLLALLRRGLDVRPESRFGSMPELLGRLERALRRPRLLLIAASAAALLALAVVAFRAARSEAPDRLSGVWSSPQRQQVRQAFLLADPASGASTGAQIESEIDAYATRWRAIDEDSHRMAIRTGAVLLRDRQRLCLDARRAELRALLVRLETWKTPELEPAIRGVHSLSDLGSCADMRALQNLKAPLLDDETRRAIVPVRARLEEQNTLFKTGGALDVEKVDRLVGEAERLGYLPLTLRAHEIRAAIRNDRGLPGATADLESALHAAVGAADHRDQVRIFALLAETIGQTEGRYADARLWRNLAEAGLNALEPGHEELEILVQRSLGAVALAEGDLPEALRRYSRALLLAERSWGKESTRLPEILNNLSIATPDLSRSTEILERIVTIQERAYGPDSPLLMSPLTNLAGGLAYSGRYRQALGMVQRTLRIQDAYYGPDFRDRAYPLFLSAQILIALDEPAEAMAPLARATALVEKGYGERHHLVGEMWCARAEAELAELRTNAAAESVAHCHALVSQALPPSHPVHITLKRLEGELALARGQANRARAVLAEAAAMPGATNLETMQVLAPWAEANLAAGDLMAARKEAEAGLALRNQDADPALAGRLRLALARAVARTEPGTASELARQALRDLRSNSPRTRALRAQAAAWPASDER